MNNNKVLDSLKTTFKQEIEYLDIETPHLYFAQITNLLKRILKSILKTTEEYTLEEYLIKIETHSLIPIEIYEKLKVLILTSEHYRYGNTDNPKESIRKINNELINVLDIIEPFCNTSYFTTTAKNSFSSKQKHEDIAEKAIEKDVLSTEMMIEKMLSTEDTSKTQQEGDVVKSYEHITSFPLQKMHRFEFDEQEISKHILNLHIKHNLIKGKEHEQIIKQYASYGIDSQHIKYLIKLNSQTIEKIKKLELSAILTELVIYVSLLALHNKTASETRQILLKKSFNIKDINRVIDEVYPRQHHSPIHHA